MPLNLAFVLVLAGCGGVETGPPVAERNSHQVVLVELPADAEAPVDDVSISDDEFAALANEYGLWDVPLDENGRPIDEEVVPPPLASCTITATVTSASATQASSGTMSESCYGYATYKSSSSSGGADADTEADCFVKYNKFGKYSAYTYDDTNLCARTADLYYYAKYGKHKFSAYYDSSGNVYLRMDSKWCKYSDCEDGFDLGK